MEKDAKEDETVCIFIELLSNCSKTHTTDLIKLSDTRLQTVLKSSKKGKDDLNIHNDEGIMACKACFLEYTSYDHISRHLRRKSNSKQQELVPTKRTRRSIASFDFKKKLLFCANSGSIEPDSKHRDRWRKNKGMLCCTADRGKGKRPVKDVLLEENISLFFGTDSSEFKSLEWYTYLLIRMPTQGRKKHFQNFIPHNCGMHTLEVLGY